MKTRKIFLALSLIGILLSSLTLARCGSGVGKLNNSTANGMKF